MKGDTVIADLKERLHRLRAPHWWGIRPFRRHSLVLMVAGGVYVLIGVSYIVTQPSPGREVALYFATYWFSFTFWGFMWILTGVMSIISSRWPPISETWGYMVLTGMSAGWAMFYFVGVIFGESPSYNLSAVCSWGLIAFLWWAISGLLNPADKTAVALHPEE